MAANSCIVKLQSNDGEIFEVDVALIQQSEILRGFSESEKNNSYLN